MDFTPLKGMQSVYFTQLTWGDCGNYPVEIEISCCMRSQVMKYKGDQSCILIATFDFFSHMGRYTMKENGVTF